MDVLPLHFRTLEYCGLWWETDEPHWSTKYIWKPFIIAVIFVFTFSQMIALIVHPADLNSVTECLFSGVTYVTLCFKLVNFLYRREEMIELLNKYRKVIYAPKTAVEAEMFKKNLRFISFVFKFFMGMAQAAGSLFYVIPLFYSDYSELPFKTYEIWSKDNRVYYWFAYAFQSLAIIVGITVNACFDTTVCGFILLICGQIDLCCHRFVSRDDNNLLEATKDFVGHHVFIIDVVRQLESLFMGVIVPFFFFGLIALGSTVFILSQSGILNVESISFILYVAAVNVQVFLYCWFGNELILKSEQIFYTMYNFDWDKLKYTDRKNLFHILIAGQKSLSISFYGFCTVSLEIYIWVLKASYAAYSILKKVASDN